MLTSVGGNDLVDWDDNGNLVCDGVSSFEYNYDNKMYGASCIAEPNIFVAVGYDCENNRVSRISGDANGNFTSRKYILDYSGGLPKVLVELEPDGGGWSVVARNYHYGDRLISSVDGSGSSRFYVHDRNGNVRNVINSSGSVLNSYSYTPYGEDIAAQCAETVENRWKYTGQYEDREIGQYYLRARQYSPYLARFNGYDPVYGDYTEPFTLHQYLYCANDPINFFDPTGEKYWSVDETQQLVDECVEFVDNEGFPDGALEAFAWRGYKYDMKYTYGGDTFEIEKGVIVNASEMGNYLTSYTTYYLYGPIGGVCTRLGGEWYSRREYGEPDDLGSRYFISAALLKAQADRGGARGVFEKLDFINAKMTLLEGYVERYGYGTIYDQISGNSLADKDQELSNFSSFWNSGRLY